MLVDLRDSEIVITDVAYRDRTAIRALPGAKFRDDLWRVVPSWPAVKILRSLFGARLEIGDDLRNWVWREYTRRVEPMMTFRHIALDPEAVIPHSLSVPALYPYQVSGAWFLSRAQGSVLADEMGTGKSAQAIAALEEASAYPALVVAPKSAKAGWEREFAKWAPHRNVVVVRGSAAARRKLLDPAQVPGTDVWVVNWDQLRLHSRLAPYGSIRLTGDDKTPKELNRHWAAVIADEAHRAVSPKAKQTRALWAVGASAGLRIAMTGTPIADAPDDLWSLLHFVAPHEWPSRTKYIDRWCRVEWNAFGGVEVVGLKPETRDEFHELVAPRLLRRPKDLVLPWLPPKVRERRDAEMAPKQAKAYKQFRDEMVADLDGGTGIATDPLSLLTRLMQLASATLEMHDQGYILRDPSNKIDALVELLGDMGDEPLVVFAQSRQLIELAQVRLAKEGIDWAAIVGGQSELVRSQQEKLFSDGAVRVLLLTLGAGSEALTLVRASTVCFLQRSWSLIQNKQAEDRVHRPGQDADKVTIVDIVAPTTVEEDLLAALDCKGDRLEEIVRDKELLRRTIAA